MTRRGPETSETNDGTTLGLPSGSRTRTKARKRKEWDKVWLDLLAFDEARKGVSYTRVRQVIRGLVKNRGKREKRS